MQVKPYTSMADRFTARNYGGWKVSELQSELKVRGARRSGRKAELIERLEAYDRNANFGSCDLVSDKQDFQMALPSPTSYKDITACARHNVNLLTKGEAAAFLSQCGTSLCSGRRLYQERFLVYLRWAASDNCTFYMGQCRAEMRRSVTYATHVNISREGEILETQCECPVGMGPSAYCKHVKTVLLAVVDFSDNRHPILEETSTEQIQAFHRPRKQYHGSPIKCQNLKLRKESRPFSFDPRPQEYKNLKSYPDYVKNLTMNHCNEIKRQTPLLQTISPANMLAADLDHTYASRCLSEQMLANMKLTCITPAEADQIEESTVNKGQEWKSLRLDRIQSSNFGRILGAMSNKAKENIARDIIDGSQFTSKYTAHGHQHEPLAIKKYSELYGVEVKPCGIVVAMDAPFLGSTPDGLVGEDIVLEVKCPYVARQKSISPTSVAYLKKDEDKLVLCKSHNYYAQVQGQMYCTERQMCHFVVYTLAPDCVVIEVPFDKLFVDAMLQKLKDFFNYHFKPYYLRKHFYRDYYYQ